MTACTGGGPDGEATCPRHGEQPQHLADLEEALAEADADQQWMQEEAMTTTPVPGVTTPPTDEQRDGELRSNLYVWLMDRTSQPDGDTWTHEQLMPAARDLARLVHKIGYSRG